MLFALRFLETRKSALAHGTWSCVPLRSVGIVLVLFTLLAATCVAGCQNEVRDPKFERVTIGGHEFELELALDEHARSQGLMWREEIPEDGGMLFVFPDMQVRNFWMGYCLVDIDIIYLDGRGYITATHRMKAEPLRREGETEAQYRQRMRHYSSVLPAQFAIELRSGWLDELKLSPSDRIDLDIDRLKRLAR